MKFGGTIIHKARDQYGLIEVIENRTLRKLHFDSPVEQSCIFRDAPMTLNFEYQQKIVALVSEHFQQRNQPQGYRILMLGMGGGTMAHNLYHTLPNVQLTIVELRQIVIDVAYRFFHLPDVPEIESVQSDAIEYIAELADLENQIHNFDCIIVDLFDAHGIPSELCEFAFHNDLQQCVKADGRIIYNLWNRMAENRQKEPTEETGIILNIIEDLQERVRKRQNSLMRSTSNLIVSLDF
ncbi:hypothetical protein THMIRHAS_05450 [Thiosulfatimonas sediminis]|uniref:Spermidine synthase n=1 Tax=Thiosulfatimonas sediminis TaxID=2675054 RepID=A0A6F8PSR0_9GAMM|nr:hypothetical protein [Thiosulfatimonas sediminis]BBP45172.1 hypothetical protein THMIRHAS_05450 [Thiosulfatimonas sediminis]